MIRNCVFAYLAAPLLDACGCDTLRSQSSRGTHSDTSSRIVEVPEDSKDD